MSESQAIDHPRVWWKEAIKGRRVRAVRCRPWWAEARGTATTLEDLGMARASGSRWATTLPADNDELRPGGRSAARRSAPGGTTGAPLGLLPYFLAVSRFAPEKNLAPADPRRSRPIAERPGVDHEPRGTWCSAATVRPRLTRSRPRLQRSGLRRTDPSSGLPPGRKDWATLVCIRLSLRTPQPDGAVGPRGQRGGGLRPSAAGHGQGMGAWRRWSPEGARRPARGFDPRERGSDGFASSRWMARAPWTSSAAPRAWAETVRRARGSLGPGAVCPRDARGARAWPGSHVADRAARDRSRAASPASLRPSLANGIAGPRRQTLPRTRRHL